MVFVRRRRTAIARPFQYVYPPPAGQMIFTSDSIGLAFPEGQRWALENAELFPSLETKHKLLPDDVSVFHT